MNLMAKYDVIDVCRALFVSSLLHIHADCEDLPEVITMQKKDVDRLLRRHSRQDITTGDKAERATIALQKHLLANKQITKNEVRKIVKRYEPHRFQAS